MAEVRHSPANHRPGKRSGHKVHEERRPSKSSSMGALRPDRFSPVGLLGSRPRPVSPPTAATPSPPPFIPKATLEDQWLARTLHGQQRGPSKVPSLPQQTEAGWEWSGPRRVEPTLSSPTNGTKRCLNNLRLGSTGSLGGNSTGRPKTPQSTWQRNTLATLGRCPKKGDDFDEPAIHQVFDFQRRHSKQSAEGKSTSTCGPPSTQISARRSHDRSEDQGSTLSGNGPGDGSDSGDICLAGARYSKMRKEPSMERLRMYLPDADNVLARLRGGEQGFSESELERMKATFTRFRMPDSAELHKDDLPSILKHLGYMHVENSMVRRIADEIVNTSTFDAEDFDAFMERYAKYEVSKYREVFEKFDLDQNGSLDDEEIMKFLSHLGYTPLRSTVKEAVTLVDLDANGTLEFEEVVLLMNLYRHSEGFSRAEVDALSRVFAEFERIIQPGESAEALPTDKLAALLTKFFGPAHYENATKLAEELVRQPSMTADDDEPEAIRAKSTISPGVPFSEALIWARRLRDKEFESYRAAFQKFDTDESGTIDLAELHEVLKSLGFTLSECAIKAMLLKAHERGHCPPDASLEDMDYDAFVHFMQILSETDGFTKEEMASITDVFKRFDTDGSEDIDVVELSDVLNYLGYATSLDQVHILLSKVDYYRSGVLGFREFVRFMRLHREFILAAMKEVYEDFSDGDGMLSTEMARLALAALREKDKVTLLNNARAAADPEEKVKRRESISGFHTDIQVLEIDGPLDYNGFFMLAERLREERVKELRRRAGFTDMEIARIRDLFHEYAATVTGSLSIDEVTKLLVHLGFPLSTREQQQDLMSQLKDATARAVEIGAVENDGTVNLWVLVQLIRGLYRRDDKITMDKVLRAAQQSRFSPTECAEFREVFTGWYERDRRFESGDSAVDQPSGDSFAPVVGEEERKAITKTSLVRLLRCLGLKVEASHRALLDQKVAELDTSDRKVDFADFLRLMRWMMDTNFADISKAASENDEANASMRSTR